MSKSKQNNNPFDQVLADCVRPTEEEIQALFGRATFFVDTNVLLRLYEYPLAAREGLFRALESLSTRLWVPYHVLLEFSRLRPEKLLDAQNHAEELADLADRLRHLLDELEEHIGSSVESAALLNEVEEAVVSPEALPNSMDAVLERLQLIIEDRVCGSASTQEQIQELLREAKHEREELPPGYRDAKKDKFLYFNGVKYPKGLGDLIIWKQVLAQAKDQKCAAVVFLTNEAKDDWWLPGQTEETRKDAQAAGERIDRRYVPRPELAAELRSVAGVGGFWILDDLEFIRLAKLGGVEGIEDQAVQQAEDFAQQDLLAGLRPWGTAREVRLPLDERLLGRLREFVDISIRPYTNHSYWHARELLEGAYKLAYALDLCGEEELESLGSVIRVLCRDQHTAGKHRVDLVGRVSALIMKLSTDSF